MTENIRPITRALISVSDKTGLVEFARGLAEPRRRAGVDRRHPQDARRRRAQGHRRVRHHRLPGDDGRPGEDAASQGARRAAGDPRQRRARTAAMQAHGIAPIDLVVVNLYPFEETVAKGADFDDLHREHRHRRPGDDPRRRQEPRLRRRWSSTPEDYAAVLDELQPSTARRTLALRKGSPPRPMRAPPPTTPRSRTGSRKSSATTAPAYPRLRRQADGGAALRREPAPAGGILSPPASSAPGVATAGRCRARSSPTTTSTTPTRRSSASRSSIPAHRRPSPSSSTPIPAASPRAPASLDAYRRRCAAIRSRAFGGIVALNRTLDAEAARAITEIFTEVIIAPDATDEAIAIVGAKKNLRLLLAGGLPDPRGRRAHGEVAGRRAAGAVARQCSRRRHGPQGRHQARADQRGTRRPDVRVPGRQARQVEHHRLRQGRRDRRHRRGPDEPGRLRPHRRPQGAGRRRGGRARPSR